MNISNEPYLAVETVLVDNAVLFRVERNSSRGVFGNREVNLYIAGVRSVVARDSEDVNAYLGQDHKFVARQVVLLDRVSEDDLRLSVRVHL